MSQINTFNTQRNLVIIDVSALMRTHYRPIHSKYPMYVEFEDGNTLNTSHLYGLFRQINDYGIDTDFIFAYDTKFNLLKQENPEYKAGRVKVEDEYFIGHDLGRSVLEQAGFLVLTKDGYEADHLIIHAKEELSPYYDLTRVITNDKDLTVVVDESTHWVGTRRKQKDITLANYEEELGCPYNSIHLKKALVGDPSDNLKGIKGFGPAAFKKFITNESIDFNNVYKNEREVIEQAETLNDNQKQQALADLRMIQPLEINNINLNFREIDWDYFLEVCETLRMKTIIKGINKQLA